MKNNYEKKIELLAPAKNFKTVQVAINAGADSVYIGGKLFGARAFAESVSEDRILDAIDLCHKYNKKIYLTVNNLIKTKEFELIDEYLKPIVDKKIDGFIVCDLGLATYLKNNFDVPLHSSTQMNIMTNVAVKYLKKIGFKKIILSRELNLSDIEKIRIENLDVEIECFGHGSMCYSYSGNCLMSSFIGGNSGNRGRCKGACRLEYFYDNKYSYLLSMKDMCVIRYLKNLIDLKIDTLKIEGRMRSEIYVAGVVSIYRELIDKIYNNEIIDDKYLDQCEKNLLEIYDKGGFTNYYFDKKNMIQKFDRKKRFPNQNLISFIKNKYINKNLKIILNIKIVAKLDKKLTAYVYKNNKNYKILSNGENIKKSINQSISENDFKLHFLKTGNTNFLFNIVDIEFDNNIFIPISEINKFRRTIIDYDFC